MRLFFVIFGGKNVPAERKIYALDTDNYSDSRRLRSDFVNVYSGKEFQRKKRQLSLTFSSGMLTDGPKLSEPVLFITVKNPGYRAVTIEIPRIRLPDRKSIAFIRSESDVKFPYELKEGKQCRIWTEIKGLATELSNAGYSGILKLKAEVEDGTGKIYVSKKVWKFNINEWRL